MSDYIVDGADLTSVADAIRTKGGTSAQLAFPAGFVSAVQAIPTGGTPTGTKQISITANGTTTEDVAAYANAEITVNVPSGGGDYVAEDFMNMGKPTGEFVFTGTTTTLGMKGRTGITKISMPNATNVVDDSFYGCTNVTSVYAPKVKTIGANAFRKMKLVYAVFPSLTNISGTYAFYENNNTFLAADFGGVSSASTIAQYTFRNQTKFKTLVLRGTAVWTLSNINAFAQCPFAKGLAGGKLYVPQDLISDYQAATNWSTILGYANNQILSIEGSAYETKYVDGTPIPTT